MKVFKRIMSSFVVLAIFSIITGLFTDLLRSKSGYQKYADFFEQDEDFDVLFMGSSHMLNAVLPMELWNDYGMVSYNFGNMGCYIPATYWSMKNALDYTTPKLIVIDCYFLNKDIKKDDRIGNLHKALDVFPISKNKIRAIYDLFDSTSERIEFLYDFSIYHNRWNEMSKGFFTPNSSTEKGSLYLNRIAEPAEFNKIDDSKKLDKSTTGTAYLERMIEECKKRDIEVLLTYLPFPASEANQMDANRVHDIAAAYDVNYINFFELEDFVDFDTDCADPKSHLNLSGALKVTDYLGQYITDNYSIEDHRNDSEYEFWNQDYEEYVDYKINSLKKCDTIQSYLVSLSDKGFSFVMQIDKDARVLEDSQINALLGNLNIDVNKLSNDSDTLVIVSNGGQSVEYVPYTEKLTDGVDSDLGVLCLKNDAEDIEGMYLGTQQCWKLDTDTEIDIRIAVIDNRNQEVIDSAGFVYESSFERKEQ